ncbi:tRNA lysidine(34) synthetase [Haliovirga abyssi]|uniref:tRNA 2-thiocytidine(32) synthetase TtcA n=1 Tax=Haliovirga abyssi TaxID=2996794 RepID=A0AAU9E105_9FUSO|nr:ATP-binding protein [Haliovirga abyssi]BDU51620.1 tRNA 2-thiocytidine(32) synthetase TtcA [Haliovirga abyssi]
MEKREILKEIEIKGFNKTLWNKAGKAMHRYNMINPGDKIVVGISGGKDSLVMLNTLIRVKLIAGFDFEIIPIFISKTEKISLEVEKIKKYISEIGLKLIVKSTTIDKIVFEDKKVKNPCFLCSRIRRGVLYTMMKELGANKLALGHHLDDIIETFFMNMFYQGNMNQMKPIYRSEQYGYEIIRPLSFVEEDTIIKYARKAKLPIINIDCKFSSVKLDSKRVETKELIKNLEKKNPNIRRNMYSAIFNISKEE